MLIRRIDRKSLTKNPNAGQRSFLIHGRRSTFAKEDGSIVQVQEVQRMYSIFPEPRWLYEYVPLQIQCNSCKESFDVDELEGFYDVDGYCSVEDARICPRCGDWECCPKIIAETISDITDEELEQAKCRN